MVFVMDRLWLAQKSNNKTPLGFRSGRPFLPITPLLNYCRMKLVGQKLLRKKFLRYFKKGRRQFMKRFKRISQITYYVLVKQEEEVKSHRNGWVLTLEMRELPIMKAINLYRQVL